MPEVEGIGDQADVDHRTQRQQPSNQAAAAVPSMDDGSGAEHRRQGSQAGERGAAAHRPAGDADGQKPTARHDFARNLTAQLRHHPNRQQRAGEQFPGTKRRQEENRHELGGQQPDGGSQRDGRTGQHQSRQRAPGQARTQQQKHREQDVELFFNRQGPGV